MTWRCQQRPFTHHQTHDSVISFTDAALQTLKIAEFPRGHHAMCDCIADNKISRDDCNGLHVYDGDDTEVAHFIGKQFHGKEGEKGSLVVYRLPQPQTQDQRLTLRKLNELHREFYKRGPIA